MNIIFFDTETTGNGGNDRLCQLAVKARGVAEPIVNAIYSPPVPISYEAMAIHHITQKMTEGRPAFRESDEYGRLKSLFESGATVAVAHNASFDISMLAREGIKPLRTICTYKVARTLDADEALGNYKLQYLRYALGLDVDASAHDAWGDVVVLEGVFEWLYTKLLEEKGSEAGVIETMLGISALPMLFSTIRFGKYNGKKISEIARRDKNYLEWLLKEKRKDPEAEADWIFTLEHYLSR